MRVSLPARLLTAFLGLGVCGGCGAGAPGATRIPHGTEDAAARAPESHAIHDAWALRLHLDAAGSLRAEPLQPAPHGCDALVLFAGEAQVWAVALDSTGAVAGTWGPFAPGHVTGGFGAPALVLAASAAAQRARNAGAHGIQLVRADAEPSPRTHLAAPAGGDFAVVESGPTRVVSRPDGRTRALLNYRLGNIGFSRVLPRWTGIRGDEYALNRVVIFDNDGQVLHESIVTKATYDAARVFGAGRWVDWVGTSPRGDVVRVVADLAGPAVRTVPVPPGWQHRTASPSGAYVLAQDGTRLTLYRDVQPDALPAAVWVRDEAAVIQDATVRDDGMVAYHVVQRLHADPVLRLVCVDAEGHEPALSAVLPADAKARPGLHFAGCWLIEGLRAPLEPATDRMIVLHDLPA